MGVGVGVGDCIPGFFHWHEGWLQDLFRPEYLAIAAVSTFWPEMRNSPSPSPSSSSSSPFPYRLGDERERQEEWQEEEETGSWKLEAGRDGRWHPYPEMKTFVSARGPPGI